MYAEVIINNNAKALNKIFDYIIPKNLETNIHVGSRIFVPFGKGNRVDDGFVIGLKEKSDFANKEIISITEDESLNEFKVELAKLMARKYFCNISDCIKLMLPPGTTSEKLSSREKGKKENFVYLNKEKEEIEEAIDHKIIKTDKQKRVLEFLFNNEGINISDLAAITDVSSAVLKTLEKNGYIKIVKEQVRRNPFLKKNVQRDAPKELNEEQKKCFNGILNDIKENKYSSNLIYGITGSGKTEIYLQLISEVLKLNKTAIVLVPEISLTPQMVDRFLARFGDIIAVLHSKLSNGERYDEWKRIESGEARIVIGARSAIFAPVKNLGLIIIDEEHDMSYKSDMTPRYNAKDLADYIAKENNCPLILGSATPDVCDFYKSESDKINRYTLRNRAGDAELPDVEIVDLRQELQNGNKSMISGKLKAEIEKNLENKKQTMLFLNRRGYSTFVMCRDCGYTAKCKNCNVSLTYHKFDNKLKCHMCGYETNLITVCPKCGSKNIRHFGTGTQKLEDEVKKTFPGITTIRMDIDTVTKKNSHEEILDKFKNDKIDVLVGTQMIVKGHHFPDVTLVGIMAADSSLNVDDYRATERTFQTIVQAAGRAGREKEKGRVIIQTYNPDSYVINLAKEQNYDEFFNAEIELRRNLRYPPFCDIVMIRFTGPDIDEIKTSSNLMYKELKKYFTGNRGIIYEPIPAPIDKIKNKYRWRIILKGKANNKMIDVINYSIEKVGSLKSTAIVVDINPGNMG